MKIISYMSWIWCLFVIYVRISNRLTKKRNNRAFIPSQPYVSSCDPHSQYRPWFTKNDVTWRSRQKL